jgi:hypothetical protein
VAAVLGIEAFDKLGAKLCFFGYCHEHSPND